MTRPIGKHIALQLLVFLCWSIVAPLALFTGRLPESIPYRGAVAVVYLLLVYTLFIKGYLLRSPKERKGDRWDMLRLRPLEGPALVWTLASVPLLLALSWSLAQVYVGLVPVPPEAFNPFGDLLGSMEGRLVIILLAVGMAPVIEELFFRGLIQVPLERKYDPARGLLFASALFAAVHFLPWVFPIHLFLGIVFGFVVWATRSIWSGVLLHAANNGVAVIALVAPGAEEVTPTIWAGGPSAEWWVALGVLAGTAALCRPVAYRLLEAGRGAADGERVEHERYGFEQPDEPGEPPVTGDRRPVGDRSEPGDARGAGDADATPSPVDDTRGNEREWQ